MLPVIHLGPLAIQLPGLILLAGLYLGLTFSERGAKQRGIHPDHVYTLVLVGLGTGLVGARVFFILQNPAAFLVNWKSVFSLNPGLFDLPGGVIAAVLGAWIYGQRCHLPFWATLDSLVPLFAGMALAIPLANLASGAGYGLPADLPWAINLWGARRHPTQLYEALAAFLILFFLISHKPVRSLPPGIYFWLFVFSTAGTRLFLEAFRAESPTILGNIRVIQVLAWLVLGFSLWQLRKRSLAPPGLNANWINHDVHQKE